MTFIKEIYTSLTAAKASVEEASGKIKAAEEAAQQAENQMALALAGVDLLAGAAAQTGIEEDMEKVELLSNEIKEGQEYTATLAGEWESKAEVAEGTIQKIEAIQGFLAEMGPVE